MFCFNTWRSGSQNYYFSGFKTIMLIFRCFSSRAGPFPWPFLVLLWSTWTYPLLPPARWNSVGDGSIDGYDDDYIGQVDQTAQSEEDVFHLPDELVLLLCQLSLHILGPASFPGIFIFTIVQGDINCGSSLRLTSFWIISSQISSYIFKFLKFPLKFSISSQPGWQAGIIKATLLLMLLHFADSFVVWMCY